jgi:YidC/Oxa1 family membrane protein insertase
MADQPNNPTPPGKPPRKELSMEVRLVLAFVLMGLVLFLTPYFYKAPPPVKPTPGAAKQSETTKTTEPTSNPAAPPQIATTKNVALQPAPGEIHATSEQEFTVDTQIYRIRLSNKGGVVQSWMLKKYLDHAGKPLELLNPAAFTKVPPPFSLALKDEQASNALNYGLYVAKPDPDGLGIQYEFSDGTNYAKKSFHFSKNGYLSEVTTEVTHNGAPVEHMIAWRGGFGDSSVLNRVGERHAVYYDLSQSKLITKDAKSVKDGPLTTTGNFSFAGLDDKFFAFVFLPKDNTSTKVLALKDDAPIAPSGKDEMQVGVEVGGDSVNHLSAFVGPKDVDLLRIVDPKLQQLIDWGWFGVIAKPLFYTLHWLNDNLLHNYGWSIVAITVIINLVLLPLRFTSLKSQRKMQRLQPQIAAINAKYKGLSLRDPKKAQQNQEVMELYKKEGVNPMGGCLPMVIQLPAIYALYKVFAVSIELRGAHWFWITDLSQPEQLAIRILPVLLIVTQFAVQKMTPNPGMDPAQAKMMGFMPLMFGFLFYNMPSGLVLYWLTSNLTGILQQWGINKTMPPPPAPAPKIAPKKKT